MELRKLILEPYYAWLKCGTDVRTIRNLYIFFFIILLFVFSLNKLNEHLDWGVFTYINIFFYLSMFFYAYKAMRKFYEQRRAKTIIKYLLLLLLFLILMMLLFLAFIFFSFFTI